MAQCRLDIIKTALDALYLIKKQSDFGMGGHRRPQIRIAASVHINSNPDIDGQTLVVAAVQVAMYAAAIVELSLGQHRVLRISHAM